MKKVQKKVSIRMTSVADFIPIWETVVGAEMFPKCLPEQGRANLATALVQFSNNHQLSKVVFEVLVDKKKLEK